MAVLVLIAITLLSEILKHKNTTCCSLHICVCAGQNIFYLKNMHEILKTHATCDQHNLLCLPGRHKTLEGVIQSGFLEEILFHIP